MKRIEKIYRDQPDPAGLYEIAVRCHYKDGVENCDGNCRQCTINYLNEEVPEYDAKFIEKLKAVKVLYPQSRYLAMNASGLSCVHFERPDREATQWLSTQKYKIVESFYNYSNDWKNSLIDIDKVIEEVDRND